MVAAFINMASAADLKKQTPLTIPPVAKSEVVYLISELSKQITKLQKNLETIALQLQALEDKVDQNYVKPFKSTL